MAEEKNVLESTIVSLVRLKKHFNKNGISSTDSNIESVINNLALLYMKFDIFDSVSRNQNHDIRHTERLLSELLSQTGDNKMLKETIDFLSLVRKNVVFKRLKQ